ncbi:conserved hypothetical protein [Candidatus Terasakiella magnetica]|nr:conserved hypothetical protein [Candidatus Terasakiella magnetica]
MTTQDDMKLAELLCARLCHDLAGPVGAASAGAELMEEGGDPETARLVALSAGWAAARLKFFRAALGPGGNPQAAAALHDLALSYLKTANSGPNTDITLAWSCGSASLDADRSRLLLNLILLARDALVRGGRIEVSVAGAPAVGCLGLSVGALGPAVTLGDEAKDVLTAGGDPDGPRGALAWFARRLAERLGGGLRVEALSGGLKFEI